MNRENTQETGSNSPGSRSSPSRSQQRTPKAPEGEDGGEVESPRSAPKSAVSLGKIEEEEGEADVEDDTCVSSTAGSKKTREIVLGERSTYVEVNTEGDDVTDDAFRVRHLSPIASELDGRDPPPGAAPAADHSYLS